MPIRDTRLLAKALMQRWPINPKMREGIIGALARVLTDPNASHREKTSAAKALMAADAQNIEMEKMQQADEHEYRARLVQLAQHIPIGEVARLAESQGITLETRREGSPSDDDESEASQGARHSDSKPDEHKTTD